MRRYGREVRAYSLTLENDSKSLPRLGKPSEVGEGSGAEQESSIGGMQVVQNE